MVTFLIFYLRLNSEGLSVSVIANLGDLGQPKIKGLTPGLLTFRDFKANSSESQKIGR